MLYQDWDLELAGTRIRITQIKEEDAEPFGRLMIGRFYDDLPESGRASATGLRSILNRTAEDEIHAIRPLLSNQFIGWITLQKNPEGQPDIGVSLIPDYQNKGYGPEAIQLFGNYLYETYRLRKISGRISSKNYQSQNAVAKLGAVFVREVTDHRYESLLESSPHFTPTNVEGMKVRCYDIPLPISKILSHSGEKPDDDAKRQAQAAYEKQEKELIKEAERAAINALLEEIENLGDGATADDMRGVIQSHIAEYKKN